MTLIKIPADIPVIEGARFRGTHFEPTTKDSKPLKPYVNISTQQGTVKKYINYPLRQDTTAYDIGDRVSVSATTAEVHFPTTQTVTTGTLTDGTVDDLALLDGTMVQITETTGSPGFDVRYEFGSLSEAIQGRVVLEGYYGGSGGHTLEVQAWNYTSETWDTLGTLPDAVTVTEYIFGGLDADNTSAGATIIRFYHSSPGNVNHSFFLDELFLEEAGGGTTELYLEATAGGTSNGTAPAFSAAQIGTTVADDSVTWKIMGYHTLEGPRIEGAATNLLTCRKANPVDTTGLSKGGDASATLSVVDATAAIASSGLSDICTSGKVYKLDNSSGIGPATALSVATTLNAIHSIGAFFSGSGTGNIVFSDNVNPIEFTLSSTFLQYKKENYLVGAGIRLRITADAGAVVYFILPELVEAPFLGSPIIGDPANDLLATVTRPGDIVTAPWPSGLANNWFAQLRVKPLGSQDGTYAWASRSDAGNLVAILMQTASVTFRKKVASTDTDVSVTYTHDTEMIDLDFYQHSTGMGIRYREFDGSWGAWSAWQTVTTAAGKADAVPGSVFSLGALYDGTTTSGHHHGNYQWKEIGQFPTGTADPQAYMEAL